MDNLKKFLQVYYLEAVLLIFSIPVFLLYCYLPVTTASVFNSPDETATYFFARHYAQTGELSVDVSLNPLVGNQLHPRSINVTPDGKLVPGSFLGMILIWGDVGKIFGVCSIEYLTPVLAVFGLWAFFAVQRRFWGKSVAFAATVLLAVHPVYLYYGARTMMNNVPIVSLFFIAWYFLWRALEQYSVRGEKDDVFSRFVSYGLFGLTYGALLAIRPSELVWTAGIFALFILWQKKKLQWGIVLSGAVVVLFIGTLLHYNKDLYGGYFTTGYSQLETASDKNIEYLDITAANGQINLAKQALIIKKENKIFDIAKALVVPFGFHPRLMLKNLYQYILYIFWWLTIPMFVGFVYLVKKIWTKQDEERQSLIYLLILFGAGIFLLVYYGSWWLWLYHEGYDISKPSIDLSYVRYFLPIYALGLPLAVLGIIYVTAKIKSVNYRILTSVGISAAIIYLGLYSSVADPRLGLVTVKQTLQGYSARLEKMTSMVSPNNSVIIIPTWGDKIYFPTYRVMAVTDGEKFDQAVVKLLDEGVNVYYYSDRPDEEIMRFSESRLSPLGCEVKSVGTVFGNEKLNMITLIK